jgi:hypothetical protein
MCPCTVKQIRGKMITTPSDTPKPKKIKRSPKMAFKIDDAVIIVVTPKDRRVGRVISQEDEKLTVRIFSLTSPPYVANFALSADNAWWEISSSTQVAEIRDTQSFETVALNKFEKHWATEAPTPFPQGVKEAEELLE